MYGLRYAEFVVPLVKAVQELHEENTKLKKQLTENNTALQKQIDELKTLLPSSVKK
jgi:trimeric autotransporter adhesin